DGSGAWSARFIHCTSSVGRSHTLLYAPTRIPCTFLASGRLTPPPRLAAAGYRCWQPSATHSWNLRQFLGVSRAVRRTLRGGASRVLNGSDARVLAAFNRSAPAEPGVLDLAIVTARIVKLCL